MTAGDIMDPTGALVIRATLGATTTVGQVVHIEADDGKWDPAISTDVGKFGVAITAGDDTEEASILVKGKVEVTAWTGAVSKGSWVSPVTTGYVKEWAVADDVSGTTIIGTALEAIDSSGNGTIYVGLI